MYKRKNTVRNEKGFTLTEMLIVMVIMTGLGLAIADVTMMTIKTMMNGTRQNIAQSSVETVVNKIAEDIQQAGSENLQSILDGSGAMGITFRRYAQNMDSYTPSSTDMNYDISCYTFTPPSSDQNPFGTAYRPGYIKGGTGSGADGKCANMYKMTDANADVRSFLIEYCRPDDASTGAYTCTSSNIDNKNVPAYMNGTLVDISKTAICVWMVRLTVVYAKIPVKNGPVIDPNYYNGITSTYQTSVMLRNPYIMSLGNSKDGDDVIDCCDSDYGMKDAAWCPKKQ